MIVCHLKTTFFFICDVHLQFGLLHTLHAKKKMLVHITFILKGTGEDLNNNVMMVKLIWFNLFHVSYMLMTQLR